MVAGAVIAGCAGTDACAAGNSGPSTTTIGALIGCAPAIALLCGGVWLAVFLLWRYVSLASIVALAVLPPALVAAHRSLTDVLLGSALAVLVIAKHRSNIQRLVQGTEHRFSRGGEKLTKS